MLKKPKNASILGVIAAILFVVAMIGSSSFQECVNKCTNSTKNNQNSSSSFFYIVNAILDKSHLTCIGVFISEAHEEILAAFTVLLAFFTLALWRSTSELARDARTTGNLQLTKMESSIAEANRSAVAMEDVAKAMRDNALLMQDILQKQMRAYLAFDTALCVPQDTTTGWKFEVRFFIKNFGHTSAQAINVNSMLSIMDVPMPDSVNLLLPVGESLAEAEISPGQSFFFRTWLDSIISEEEIREIKTAGSRKMYLYGIVKYKDVFGNWHYTNFCKICQWDIGDNFITTNIGRHNDAT